MYVPPRGAPTTSRFEVPTRPYWTKRRRSWLSSSRTVFPSRTCGRPRRPLRGSRRALQPWRFRRDAAPCAAAGRERGARASRRALHDRHGGAHAGRERDLVIGLLAELD